MDIKALMKKHGVTASLVGGSLVIGTAYGSCVLSPDSAPAAEAPAEEAPETPEAPPAEAPEEAE